MESLSLDGSLRPEFDLLSLTPWFGRPLHVEAGQEDGQLFLIFLMLLNSCENEYCICSELIVLLKLLLSLSLLLLQFFCTRKQYFHILYYIIFVYIILYYIILYYIIFFYIILY